MCGNNMSTLSMRIVTNLIEYLGEFEFIFKTSLDYESVGQMCSFDAKNRHRKSHAWAPLKSSCKYILFKVWFISESTTDIDNIGR
jgi:hypothetical protein